ncbi:MAG: fibronectin type III domain-containing protein, partial [Eubacterium sp.]
MQSQAFYSHTLTVLPMDMSNWANYDAGLTSRQISSYFNGAYVDIKAEIYDSSSTKLVEGRDYVLRCYAQSDTQRANPIKPYAPGNYMVCIDYYGNYCQTLSYAFTVKKADFSSFSMASVNVRFGTDLVSACSTLKLGATTIYKDKDYSVKVIGGVNYGDEGVIRITGLSGSSYIQSGTYTDRKYKIGSRYDVSSLFNGKLISNPTYMYTGKQIKPDDFVLSYTSNGKKITLVKNKDYSIASYRNNIMSGTGYVTVKFMGNYTGTAEMKFNIECIEFEVSIPDLTYNGKKQKPSPTVKFGGHTLKYATDYTFSSSATDPGIYSCKITGKGQYSKLSITKYYFVKPNTVSSFKATSTATSVKLSWKGQGKNCYYQIYAYDTTKKKWKLIAVTNNTSYTVSKIYTNNKKTALQPNKSYKFRIRAYFSATVNGTKYTKYGGYVSLTQRTKPKTPAFKKVTKGKSYLKFTWGKDSSVNGYELVLATDSKYTKNVQKKTVKKNSTTSYTFKNLKKGKTYYVRIRSYKTVDGKKIYSAYSKTFKIKL